MAELAKESTRALILWFAKVVVKRSFELRVPGTEGRRASWTNDAEGKEIPEVALNLALLSEAFLKLLALGLGALALVWATVVLLGGFSTMLVRMDFWFTTTIVFIETARIVGYNSGPEARFFVDFVSYFYKKNKKFRHVLDIVIKGPIIITVAPIFAASAFVTLSVMRILAIVRHGYGELNSDSSNGNIKPALLLFYVLVLIQGALFLCWLVVAVLRALLIKVLSEKYFVNKEDQVELIDRYVFSTFDMCMDKGVVSTINTTLVSFAAELLQSEVIADHICAVSVLHAVITKEERTGGAVQQLCASEKSVDRLFKILSSEENSFNQEIKAYTAGILVKLSSKLCLADIPGAANCISSLLDDAHSMNPAADTVSKNHMLYYSNETQHIPTKVTDNVMSRALHCFKKASTLATGVNNGQQSIDIRNDEHPTTSSGADNKPLIIHGLHILAKLAKNPDNAIEICSTKGLFSRITAPIGNKLYKVFRDDGTAIEITEKSLQVLSKLVSGTDACQEICNSGLLNTIQPISTDDSRHNMLKVPAIKILTKLILTGSSRNESTIIDFINVLTGLFFDEANDSILRQIAGKALASLAMDRNMCVTILKGNTGTEHSVVEHLSDMLSDSRNKLYRTSIANLLMQFCALRSEEARFHLAAVKTTILHEVLKTMCNVEPQTSTNQLDLPRGINKLGSRCERKDVHDSRTHNPDKGNRYNPPAPMEPGRRKALVAFLGLAVQMMCDKLLDETDFNAAFERIPVSEAELVDKFEETIEMCNKGSVALLKGAPLLITL